MIGSFTSAELNVSTNPLPYTDIYRICLIEKIELNGLAFNALHSWYQRSSEKTNSFCLHVVIPWGDGDLWYSLITVQWEELPLLSLLLTE